MSKVGKSGGYLAGLEHQDPLPKVPLGYRAPGTRTGERGGRRDQGMASTTARERVEGGTSRAPAQLTTASKGGRRMHGGVVVLACSTWPVLQQRALPRTDGRLARRGGGLLSFVRQARQAAAR